MLLLLLDELLIKDVMDDGLDEEETDLLD